MPTNNRTRPALTQRTRDVIFAMLGGCCDECGEVCGLQVDHPVGRDWSVRKTNSYQRNRRYLKEAQAGLVRLLCADCNNAIRPGRKREVESQSDAPF